MSPRCAPMLRRELPPACRCPVFLKSVSICQSARLSRRSSCWLNAVLRANGKDKSASCHSDDQSTQLKRSAALPTAERGFFFGGVNGDTFEGWRARGGG